MSCDSSTKRPLDESLSTSSSPESSKRHAFSLFNEESYWSSLLASNESLLESSDEYFNAALLDDESAGLFESENWSLFENELTQQRSASEGLEHEDDLESEMNRKLKEILEDSRSINPSLTCSPLRTSQLCEFDAHEPVSRRPDMADTVVWIESALKTNRQLQNYFYALLNDLQEKLQRNQEYQRALARINLQKAVKLKSVFTRHPFTTPATAAIAPLASATVPSLSLLSEANTHSYWMDLDGSTPIAFFQPEANERIERESRYPRSVKSTKWTSKERVALARGVRQLNQKLLLDALMAKHRDALQELDRQASLRSVNMIAHTGTGSSSNVLSLLRAGMENLQKMSQAELAMNLTGLDWDRIASHHVPSRSAKECYIQWTVHEHPLINKRPWGQDELARFSSLTLAQGVSWKGHWTRIAEALGTNRSAADCFITFQKRLNKSLLKSKWSPAEDATLRQAVKYYGEKNWQEVASCLEGRSGQQCLHRWLKSISPAIRHGKWSAEEDARLVAAVKTHGGENKWSLIQSLVPGRTDVQCRERWMNVLDPSLSSTPWTAHEDERLRSLVATHGTGKWSWIASQLAPRTDNQCWRRWKSLLNRFKKKRGDSSGAGGAALLQEAALSSSSASSLTSSPAQSPAPSHAPPTLQLCELLTRQSDLSRRRLSAVLGHFHIDPQVSTSGAAHGPASMPPCSALSIPPIPLDAHNSLALSRLLKLLAPAHSISCTGSGTHLRDPPGGLPARTALFESHTDPELEQQFCTEPYALLSARFESLFLWPLLLCQASSLGQREKE